MPLPDCLKGRYTLPLIAAPMFLVSGPELVIAACREGIIGSFPTPNARTPEILDDWLTEISSRLKEADNPAPFAANIVVHPSNTRLDDDLKILEKHKVRQVNNVWKHSYSID